MRIVYFTGYWPPEHYASGILTAIANLRTSLEALGHDTRIVSMNGRATGEADAPDPKTTFVGDALPLPRALSAVLNRMPLRWRHFEIAPRHAAAVIASQTADVLETEESFGWSEIIARHAPFPVVTRLHGPQFLIGPVHSQYTASAFDAEREKRERRAFSSAHFLSAPSNFVLNEVRRHTGLALQNSAVVPNAAPAVSERDHWRRDSADADSVLFVGRFDAIKGADIAIAAFAAAARTRPQLRLVFVGDSTGRTLPSGGRNLGFDDYLAQTLPPEIAGRIVNLGKRPQRDLVELRCRAGAVIIASRIEMFPLVALEAAACGAPIAACGVGGIPEILTDGVDSLLVDKEEVEALGAAIGRLVDDQEFAAKLGANARARAERDFAPNNVARATIGAYEQAMARWGERNARLARGA